MARFLCFGEILLRLASPGDGVLLQEKRLEASFCGAEANAGVALAGLGHSCGIASVLPDNPIGRSAAAELRAFGLDTGHVQMAPGRMGLYFLSPGAMARPSGIIYDRAHSAFAAMQPDTFNWPELLKGVDWLFISGITPALGRGPAAALAAAVDAARQSGVKIAFDSNFRPALWAGREKDAASILCAIAEQADLLFAGRRAIGLMLGRRFDDTDPDAAFAAATRAMFDAAPRIGHIAATRRTVLSSDHHQMTALIAGHQDRARSQTIDLERIVDRVGTGDAFAAGILHGLANAMSLADTAAYALACSAWAHSIRGDFLRASQDDITRLLSGTSDVTR